MNLHFIVHNDGSVLVGCFAGGGRVCQYFKSLAEAMDMVGGMAAIANHVSIRHINL